MSRSNQQTRAKSRWAVDQRVCPVLESLEDRASPSMLSINRLLALPVEGPLAAFQEVARNTEYNQLLRTPELTRVEVPREANPGIANELALKASLSAGLSESRFSDAAQPASLVEPSAGRSVSPNLSPAGIDLLAAAGLNGGGSPAPEKTTSGQTGSVTTVPPRITDFQAVDNCDGTWTLKGHVASNYAGALAVTFGSVPAGAMPSIEGQTAEVQTDGSFQWTGSLQPDEHGIVTAKATDPQGQSSNVAEDMIHQPGCGSPSGK